MPDVEPVWGRPLSAGLKCEGQRLVVGIDVKSATFNKVLKVADREVNSQQLTIESAVIEFRVIQLL